LNDDFKNTSLDTKLQMLQLVSDIAERESDRTWRRFAILITINGALVALVSIISPEFSKATRLVAGIFGLVVSFAWYKMVPISKYYEQRWQEDMKYIISSDPVLADVIKARDSVTSRATRPTAWSASSYVRVMAIMIGAIWLILIATTVYELSDWHGEAEAVRSVGPDV